MLTVENLAVSYGNTPVLRDINITVEEGEIVGIVGKNGVGKTTLIKAIMGLLEADGGTVRFRGETVTNPSGHRFEGTPVESLADTVEQSASARGPGSGVLDTLVGPAPDVPANGRATRGMGYIPQGRDVFPELSVEENLRMGETINAADDDPLYDVVYDYFPILEERATQDAGTLSGGQQQMLAIGRALVGNPDLLLLDEPSEGIQPSIVQQITEDLTRINDELGITILFVEQNLQVIQNLATRCYAIDKGTIVDELGPADLDSRETLAEYLAV
ncbi:ABC transporter ATP-binding protein [Halobacteria archaeon AArc-m2/3/4]|uniref:ABC transporter ATP-binding protein n=1 Tax=Natronoglomus mannanivorans TaxID=2979990 RepID=A0AAP2YZQ0_9EURY|nr:ABC transporter ATP-binding protein [Halobacteria archaeon AArc-xg1-1]MCU4973491.1 ABC transporter ATP-binding protein [Halobacteria archaeon AArc-m2/3/4]